MIWSAWLVVAFQLAAVVACLAYYRYAHYPYKRNMRALGLLVGLYLICVYSMFGLNLIPVGDTWVMLGRVGVLLLSALYISEIIADIWD